MLNVEKLIGVTFRGWLITKLLGRGADGIVYAGEKDGDEVAIKIFFPDRLSANGVAAARERLELQLGLIGGKRHPNLVEIYSGGEDSQLNTIYLIMELVGGTSLDKLIGHIPAKAIGLMAGQLASAAECLEKFDLVHRDIKPANIMVSADFQTATLLDLGIVYQVTNDDDQGRLSGKEFVSTLRYSPPEFVWRTEESDAAGAWRAVTFYQIGATLHDMIMGKALFSGHDVPRAALYDCVRDRTPDVQSAEVEAWLIQTTQACLLKDWRQRLQYVGWNSFSPDLNPADASLQERKIRIRQIRKEEIRKASEKQSIVVPGPTREQQLWQLNDALALEIRTYLLDSTIFPKSRVAESMISQREYSIQLHFEPDTSRGFESDTVFCLTISVDTMLDDATKLSFDASKSGKTFASSVWTEMFTVETAFNNCRQAFLNAVESML